MFTFAPITFGRLESVLATMHGIADSKRTAFQARLKNFHRLGFPIGFSSTKGKASHYSPGHILEMALALEMTQLGLPPERVVHVLALNQFPASMAMMMAARALAERPKGYDDEEMPLSMFLFFDPSALRSLMLDDAQLTPDDDDADDTFFYGGWAIVAENLVRWTNGHRNRLSFINVTGMMDHLAAAMWPGEEVTEYTDEYLSFRHQVFQGFRNWAEERHELTYEADAQYFLDRLLEHSYDIAEDIEQHTPEELAQRLADETGLKRETIEQVLEEALKRDLRDSNKKGASGVSSKA